MDENYNETIEVYYKLKRAYEKAEKKRKEKYPTRDKKCIFCKKTGGTIFLQEKGKLIAYCGNKRKCTNKIEIKLAKYNYIPDLITKTMNILEELKQTILQIKMNTLFEFSDGKEFEKIKEKFNEQRAILVTLIKTDTTEELKKIVVELYQDIDTYKNAINSYIKEKNKAQLIDAINLYVNIIKPKQELLRKHKYPVMYIEEFENTFKLVQKKEDIREILIDKGDVISTIS